MDNSMGRRTATGVIFSRGGCSITFREQNNHGRSIRYCSRLGCCASLHSVKGTQVGEQEKAAFHSGTSKSLSASSYRKPRQKQRSRRSQEEADTTESSSRSLDIKDSDSGRRLGKKKISYSVSLSPLVASAKIRHFAENETGEVRPCSTKLSSRESKEVAKQSRHLSKENSSTSTSTSMSLGHASQDMASGSEDYGLGDPRQTEISDVLPSDFNSAGSGIGRADNTSRKRSFKRGISSSRSKSMIPSSNGTNSGSSNTGNSGPIVSLPENLISHQAARRSRNQSTSMGVVSVRTRRGPGGNTRIRPLGQVDESILIPNPVNVTRQSRSESGAVPQSSSRSSTDCHPFYQNRHGQPGSSTQITPSRPTYESVANGIHIFDAPLEDRGGYPHLNMEGVAEVLLELEMIEQDEGLTYEQLSVIENHLFSDSLSFHDQYREMRMDIDNMSYEELLALEEEMGTVTTALTEDALSRCLKRSNYMPASSISGASGLDQDYVKCSICQEEFVIGDELGRLACEHIYHVKCIHQWLRLKNWCPICKASVAPTS